MAAFSEITRPSPWIDGRDDTLPGNWGTSNILKYPRIWRVSQRFTVKHLPLFTVIVVKHPIETYHPLVGEDDVSYFLDRVWPVAKTIGLSEAQIAPCCDIHQSILIC